MLYFKISYKCWILCHIISMFVLLQSNGVSYLTSMFSKFVPHWSCISAFPLAHKCAVVGIRRGGSTLPHSRGLFYLAAGLGPGCSWLLFLQWVTQQLNTNDRLGKNICNGHCPTLQIHTPADHWREKTAAAQSQLQPFMRKDIQMAFKCRKLCLI